MGVEAGAKSVGVSTLKELTSASAKTLRRASSVSSQITSKLEGKYALIPGGMPLFVAVTAE
eukprot:8943553-Ditylum_brightwellii.AAC.1